MKVCSFLPAATQMIYDMGLEENLHAVTFECSPKSRSEKPIIVDCLLNNPLLSSAEINRIFSESKRTGQSVYTVNEKLLHQIKPDLIFTQDVCEVCQIDSKCTEAALLTLDYEPTLISLSPDSLGDVFESAKVIAKAMNNANVAVEYLKKYQNRIDEISVKIPKATSPKRILFLEWMEPVFNCGHWIPDQIKLAGGEDLLSNPSGDSVVLEWEKIRKYDPEIMVIAPCGFDVERSKKEVNVLLEKEGWNDLQCVKNKKVFVLNGDLFTQPSVSTLVEGIETLAKIFHPEFFQKQINY